MEEKIRLAVFGQKRLSREGGIEIVVKELCTRMAQNGCDITCYNRAGHHVSGAEYDKTIEYDGIRQKVVPTIEKKGLAAVSSSFFAALCSAFGRYDVVHIHAEGPAFFCWIPKLFGKRVICTIHGLDWDREKWRGSVASKFIRGGEKNAVKYADEIIVLSKDVQKYFLETYGRETHFIPNEIHYLRGDISRENCFSCEMSNTNRVSDFTFGDYWAIEIEHPEFIVRKDPALSIRKGINCMMVNTEKGMQYLSKLQEKMVMYEVDLASITRHNSNLLKPSKRGKARDAVLENYYMEGYKKIEENYNDTVGKKRTVYAAKNMIKTHIPDKLRVQIYRMKFLRKLLSGE